MSVEENTQQPEAKKPGRPAKPVSNDTPVEVSETSKIEALQAQVEQLMKMLAEKDELVKISSAPELPMPDFSKGEKILIHVVENGFTAFGNSWYVGQEIEVEVGSKDWDMFCVDRTGNTWLKLGWDLKAQREKYNGRIMFKGGPWVGEGYDLLTDSEGRPITQDAANKLALAEQKRGRAPNSTPYMS